MLRRTLMTALAAAGCAALTAQAFAQEVSFEGANIEIYVPASEGGGTDIWARTIAPMLAQELPGNPNIVVRNIPGGASLIGGNQFQSNARPDGRTLFALAGSTIMGYLFRDQRVRFDIRDWTPVLSTPQGTVVYGSPSLGIATAEDLPQLAGQRLLYGSREVTGTDLPMLLAFDMLEIDLEPIYGVSGRGDGRLGFERGEFNIDRQTTSAYARNVVPMVEAGNAVPLFSFGVLDLDGNMVRDPNFPDVPHFGEAYELVHGEEPSGPAWEAWKTFMAAGYGVSKALVLPEGTPDEIVAAYTEAIERVLDNEENMVRLADELGEYLQGVGDSAATFVNQAIDISPESEEWIRDWLREAHDVNL